MAIRSRRRERAEELAEKAGLGLGTSDYDELLSVPGLDSVHAATPVVTDLPFVVAAAQRACTSYARSRWATTVRSAGDETFAR